MTGHNRRTRRVRSAKILSPRVKADSELEERVCLNRKIFRNPKLTFLFRMPDNSFEKSGVFKGDLLVTDRSQRPEHNQLVLVKINGGPQTVRRYHLTKGRELLKADDKSVPAVAIADGTTVKIVGAITFTVHII